MLQMEVAIDGHGVLNKFLHLLTFQMPIKYCKII